MRIITKIIAVMAICFFLATVSFSIYIYNSSSDLNKIKIPSLEFTVNEDERTLTLTNINNIDFSWEDISVDQGYALLPTGALNIGDKITNCYETVKLKLPNGFIIGENWKFSEKPAEPFDDIRFIGQWEGGGQELNLYPNGTYLNHAWDFDSYPDDNESPGIVSVLQNGNYFTNKTENLLVLEDIGQGASYKCDFSLLVNDTVMNLYCYSDRSSVQLTRNLSDDTYITILNVSEKLDDCLLSFISNYSSNETYKEALSEGLNVTVAFTNNLTQYDIYNLSDKDIVFITDINGSIMHNNTNYSVKINSLQDLYNLVYRVDVKDIIANDKKFGCI